ncbi:MAG TPA: hypothetical protein VH640_16740, partial [Bryobacteraceae bacterium]
MSALLNRIVRFGLAFTFAVAARADLHQFITLQAGNRLNLDTGHVVTSGGDILWDGNAIAPQGKATAARVA